MYKKFEQQKISLNARKRCSKNKKLGLQNKFVFMTEEMLQIIIKQHQ